MKSLPHAVSRLTESGVSEAVKVLMDAFTGDPSIDYQFPEQKERPEQCSGSRNRSINAPD